MNENFPTISFDEKYEEEARVNVDLRMALDHLKSAGEAHKINDIEKAIELYKNSIAYCPTADAHRLAGIRGLEGVDTLPALVADGENLIRSIAAGKFSTHACRSAK